MEEIWKNINENYCVSNLGNVKSNRKNLILKPSIREDGYYVVNITGFRHKRNWKIHQLVAIHFLDNPNNFKSINHKNGIKTDNRVENLEWCTQSYNLKHAYRIGLMQPVINTGLKNGFSKIVLDFSTGIFYYSLNEYADLNKIKRTTLGAMLNGQNPNKTNLKYV